METKLPRVAVCGVGVVGGAVVTCLERKGVDVIAYDKYKNGGMGRIRDILEAKIVFLCLPTLYDAEIKQYDKSAIHEVCSFLSSMNYEGLVVLKSTVEPGTSRLLKEKYNLRIVHNPEFLTAQTAVQDFENQDHIVISGETKDSPDVLELEAFYMKTWGLFAQYSLCVWEESEMMKLGVNTFYSVKIQFFNELYALANKIGADYDHVMNLMLKNKWIAKHHTKVPGTDGKLSYGGMCFPKDTNALYQKMVREGTPSAVLGAVIAERNSMRDD